MTRARDLASLGDNTSKLEQAGLIQVIATSVTKGASGSASVDSKGTVTFSGTESISLNGVFNSTYENYKIVMSNMSASSTDDGSIRLRKSGTDNTSSIYTRQYNYANGLNVVGGRNLSGSFWDTGTNNQIIDLFSPNLASVKTRGIINYIYTAAASTISMVTQSMIHDLGSSADFDGFTFYPGAGNGTISGTIRVYGYNQ